jgi:hypothetical protein
LRQAGLKYFLIFIPFRAWGRILNPHPIANTHAMFSFFKKDPIQALENKRKKLLEEAMHVQRSGDLKLYAVKMEAIDKLEKEIEDLRTKPV